MLTLTWLVVIALAGGILALVDGILRVRGRGNSIIGIIELIVAALFLLSLFFTGIPLGSIVLAVVLLVLLIVGLVLRGRQGVAITVIALVLIAAYLVLANRWIVVPGIN